MSPVNEEPIEEPEDPRFAKVAIRSRALIGASDRIPIRLIVLVITIGICLTLSTTPANIIGTTALLLLTIDTVIHRR